MHESDELAEEVMGMLAEFAEPGEGPATVAVSEEPGWHSEIDEQELEAAVQAMRLTKPVRVHATTLARILKPQLESDEQTLRKWEATRAEAEESPGSTAVSPACYHPGDGAHYVAVEMELPCVPRLMSESILHELCHAWQREQIGRRGMNAFHHTHEYDDDPCEQHAFQCSAELVRHFPNIVRRRRTTERSA